MRVPDAPEHLPLRLHVLRRLNPAIVRLLQSPLHALASRRLLVLRYRGKRSGKTFAIPLAYVTHEGLAYCVTRNALWWKSAVSAPSVTIWLRGEQQTAVAEAAASEDASTRAVFYKFLKANRGTASLLYNVRVHASGEPDATDVDREIHNSHIIRLKPAA
jgi:hypothetical protein